MAHCTKCQTEWTFKDKLRTVKNLDGSAKCPYCGEKQYISLKTKRQGSMLSMIIILAIFIPVFFDIPLMVHILIGAASIIAVLIPQVAIIQLSGKEEFPE